MKTQFKFKAYKTVDRSVLNPKEYFMGISVKAADVDAASVWLKEEHDALADGAIGVFYDHEHRGERGRFLVGVYTTKRAAEQLNKLVYENDSNINKSK